jgi:hypothetical protein
MMPGAMLGLTLAACSRRDDWQRRCALLGMLGAIGFAWGGQSSYGMLIGYTQADSVPNSLYGFATLFLVGGMYGALGGGFLGLGLTQPRSFFGPFMLPLTITYLAWWEISRWGLASQAAARAFGYDDPEKHVTIFEKAMSIYPEYGPWLYDTPWVWGAVALVVAAVIWVLWPKSRHACRFILLLTCAWFISMLLLIHVGGLRINPGRNDSWAGCLGVLVAFVAWLAMHRNRASLMLVCYGGLAGGIGFSVGAFLQMVGKSKWGPVGRYEFLQQFNYWTVMEQFLGLLMGLGVAIGFCRLIRGQLAPPVEDDERGWTNEFALFLMFGPMLWDNLNRNAGEWIKNGKFNRRGDNPFPHLGIGPENWLMLPALAITLVLVYGFVRNRKHSLPLIPETPLGRSQLLMLVLTWLILGIYFTLDTTHAVNLTMFVTAAAIGSAIVIQTSTPSLLPANPVSPTDGQWSPGVRHWLLWLLVPALLWALARTTVELDLKPTPPRFPTSSR